MNGSESRKTTGKWFLEGLIDKACPIFPFSSIFQWNSLGNSSITLQKRLNLIYSTFQTISFHLMQNRSPFDKNVHKSCSLYIDIITQKFSINRYINFHWNRSNEKLLNSLSTKGDSSLDHLGKFCWKLME